MNKLQFIETIKVVDGMFINPELHLFRIKQMMKDICDKSITDKLFQEMIIPEDMRHGVIKCRILYSSYIERVDFQHYTPRDISSLKLVEGTGLDYSKKYADRSLLMELLQKKEICDDVLIIQNNRITDTSYSNVVLSDGFGYYTPTTYLLNGIRRQSLLAQKKIIPIELSVNDLLSFDKLHLINAMLDLEDGITISTKDILF